MKMEKRVIAKGDSHKVVVRKAREIKRKNHPTKKKKRKKMKRMAVRTARVKMLNK